MHFTIWKCLQGAFVSFPLDIERSNRQTIGIAADSSVGVFRGEMAFGVFRTDDNVMRLKQTLAHDLP